MTVQAVPPFKRYAANGVAPTYTIPFLLIEAGDLRITLNGTPVTTGFVLMGIGLPQSSCTFLVPPAGDLLFFRQVPLHRLVDYQNSGDFLAQTVNRDFDRIWLVLQGLALDDLRALRIPPEEIEGVRPVPARSIRSTKILAFDALGEPIVSKFTLAEIEEMPQRAADAVNEAENAANEAGQSAQDALDAENLARKWASNPVDDPVLVNPNLYSAYHWAMKSLINAAASPRSYPNGKFDIPADFTVLPSHIGTLFQIAAGVVITLPDASILPRGTTFSVRAAANGGGTIRAIGGVGNNTHLIEGVANFVIGPNELVELIGAPIASGGWWLVSRSNKNAPVQVSDYVESKGQNANGVWQRWGSGRIEQRGVTPTFDLSPNASSVLVSAVFPIGIPSANYMADFAIEGHDGFSNAEFSAMILYRNISSVTISVTNLGPRLRTLAINWRAETL